MAPRGQERLGDMSGDSLQHEGGMRYWKDRKDFIDAMGGLELEPWVLLFEYTEVSRFYCSVAMMRIFVHFLYV